MHSECDLCACVHRSDLRLLPFCWKEFIILSWKISCCHRASFKTSHSSLNFSPVQGFCRVGGNRRPVGWDLLLISRRHFEDLSQLMIWVDENHWLAQCSLLFLVKTLVV